MPEDQAEPLAGAVEDDAEAEPEALGAAVRVGREAHLGAAAAVIDLDVAHVAVGDVRRDAHCHPLHLPLAPADATRSRCPPGARDFSSEPADASAKATARSPPIPSGGQRTVRATSRKHPLGRTHGQPPVPQ